MCNGIGNVPDRSSPGRGRSLRHIGGRGWRLGSPYCHTGWVRRIGRGALVIGLAIFAGLVTSMLTTYILLRVDSSTVLSGCSFISPPAHSCSSPVNLWGVGLQIATGILGAATVGILLIQRRRNHQAPISI
jgi:hypothetical protein